MLPWAHTGERHRRSIDALLTGVSAGYDSTKVIVKKQPRSIRKVLGRCLALRCPACGQSSIVKRPFKIKDHCSACGVSFKREEGFFVGAILANVVTTEFVILVVYVISLPIIGLNDQIVLATLFVIAVLFPIAFYHHSWSFWLGFDHLVESLPRSNADFRGR